MRGHNSTERDRTLRKWDKRLDCRAIDADIIKLLSYNPSVVELMTSHPTRGSTINTMAIQMPFSSHQPAPSASAYESEHLLIVVT